MTILATDRDTRQAWVPPLAIAVAAWALNQIVPLASPLLLGLLVGVVLANTPHRHRPALARSTRPATFLLRAGVALLGLKLALTDFVELGWFAVALVLTTVATTFLSTRWLGRRLGLEAGLVDLIAAGFSICGAAAIAAVQDAIGAKRRDVALAVGLVTVFGTAMIGLIPLAGHLLGLTDEATGMWAGASIHEVAQVVAAAAVVGPGVVAIAMGIKLGRVLLLAPVHHALAVGQGNARGPLLSQVPWFLHAFVAAVLVRSTGLLPDVVLTGAAHASTLLLAAGMVGLGFGIRLRELWPVPPRALILAASATTTATLVPLALLMIRG